MILTDCSIPVDDRSQEIKPHGNTAFPCAGYTVHYRQEIGDNVPWHWHDELEIIYLAGGQIRIGTPDEVLRTEVLSELYGSPVDVVRTRGRIVVVGAVEPSTPHAAPPADGHTHQGGTHA